MKLVLSRKGLDTSSSVRPSPILPDGRLVSIPIPADFEGSGIAYVSIRATNTQTFAALMSDLGISIPPRGAHLDPDLVYAARPRAADWRPLFGQEGAAQRHLDNQGVGVGDLFLFFGRFRQTQERGGKLCWERGAPVVHAIFGYLEIGDVWRVDSAAAARRVVWAAGHPHVKVWQPRKGANTVYIAATSSALAPGCHGAGTMSLTPATLLTGAGCNTSVWRLPAAFASHIGKLSYHANSSRWSTLNDGTVALASVGRGQEFVVDADGALCEWARNLIEESNTDG
jgi:hypothetical protein